MTVNGETPQQRTARRAVLDHLLALIAGSPWAEALVLRGSMVMPAWVGPAAREPADLDWIVLPSRLVPVDELDPYPYLPDLAAARQWPEAADGAGGYEIWRHEEFDTRGLRVRLPPEGLAWVLEDEPEDEGPEETLHRLVTRHPHPAPGITLHPDSVRTNGSWAYAYDDGRPGVRVALRWTAECGGDGGAAVEGEVTVDFARDERLPEPPVRTAVPRGDGTGATTVRTASRELSLAWKLLWLHADGTRARAKDLYDAVLLAELCAHTLDPALLHRVLAREPGHPGRPSHSDHPDHPGHPGHPGDPGTLRPAVPPADWDALRAAHPGIHGTAADWLARLRTALAATATAAPQ
ncbi:nucleotidyl transferase AbiEii/AbiGii toxin family protein [Kitasatospora cineracea]|uniref:nucleotidyl transferase AbiEii/AbiGii toxin family protein n=1 Tax=Kitasatospora cineracea TaxID=88074 RepID=UPI0036C6B3A6